MLNCRLPRLGVGNVARGALQPHRLSGHLTGISESVPVLVSLVGVVRADAVIGNVVGRQVPVAVDEHVNVLVDDLSEGLLDRHGLLNRRVAGVVNAVTVPVGPDVEDARATVPEVDIPVAVEVGDRFGLRGPRGLRPNQPSAGFQARVGCGVRSELGPRRTLRQAPRQRRVRRPGVCLVLVLLFSLLLRLRLDDDGDRARAQHTEEQRQDGEQRCRPDEPLHDALPHPALPPSGQAGTKRPADTYRQPPNRPNGGGQTGYTCGGPIVLLRRQPSRPQPGRPANQTRGWGVIVPAVAPPSPCIEPDAWPRWATRACCGVPPALNALLMAVPVWGRRGVCGRLPLPDPPVLPKEAEAKVLFCDGTSPIGLAPRPVVSTFGLAQMVYVS